MTNENRQGGCAEWCGLPYGDASVPDNAVLWTHEPWTTAKNDPAYCTAACLERAREKPVKREPVAPWVQSSGGQNCTTGFNWTTRQWDDESHYSGSHAMYTRPAPDGGPGNVAVCESCAERAGVFGPVSAYTPVGTAVASPKQVLTFTPTSEPAGTWDIPSDAPPIPPTCAGPLATHGTPVLRWRRELFGDESELLMLCDACHLECEQMLMNRKRIAEAGRGVRSTEPPARIGTVPQVVSVGVGIWASRGMRKVRP